MKTCFVLSPIGSEDSSIRKQADEVFSRIIMPAAKICGYEAKRADHISSSGIITSDIVQHIIRAEMVIADLTGHNPNVFYELAVRHMLRKPVVQIIRKPQSIPFDLTQIRTVFYTTDTNGIKAAVDELVAFINSDSNVGINPISIAVDQEKWKKDSDPLRDINARIDQLTWLFSNRMDDLKTTFVSLKDPAGTIEKLELETWSLSSQVDFLESRLEEFDISPYPEDEDDLDY